MADDCSRGEVILGTPANSAGPLRILKIEPKTVWPLQCVNLDQQGGLN
jgi:hypothetical protein